MKSTVELNIVSWSYLTEPSEFIITFYTTNSVDISYNLGLNQVKLWFQILKNIKCYAIKNYVILLPIGKDQSMVIMQ